MSEHAVAVLLGISAVAATFVGFSGVVAAFDRRAHGNWLPEERFRLVNMVVISLGICLFAFFPLAEELLRVSEKALWIIASILMGGFCALYVPCALPYRKRLGQSRPGFLPLWSTLVFVLALCLAAVLQALNASEIFVASGAGLYVAGLLLLLVVAGIQFAFLVLMPLAAVSHEDRSA